MASKYMALWLPTTWQISSLHDVKCLGDCRPSLYINIRLKLTQLSELSELSLKVT